MDDRQSQESPRYLQQLADNWEVEEPTFDSTTPVVGPLLVRLRRGWNWMATKWVVRALLQQQNEINYRLAQRLSDADARLIEMDRDLSATIHDLGELTAQVIQLEHRLRLLEARLASPRPNEEAGADAATGVL
jgi:hypothetical protein